MCSAESKLGSGSRSIERATLDPTVNLTLARNSGAVVSGNRYLEDGHGTLFGSRSVES